METSAQARPAPLDYARPDPVSPGPFCFLKRITAFSWCCTVSVLLLSITWLMFWKTHDGSRIAHYQGSQWGVYSHDGCLSFAEVRWGNSPIHIRKKGRPVITLWIVAPSTSDVVRIPYPLLLILFGFLPVLCMVRLCRDEFSDAETRFTDCDPADSSQRPSGHSA